MKKEKKKKYKSIELISSFKYTYKIFPSQKVSGLFFDPHKTGWFTMPLIVLGKVKVIDGLQIHPKAILRHANKADKARRYSTQVRYAGCIF